MLLLSLKVVGRSFLIALIVSLLSIWLSGFPGDNWTEYCADEGAADLDCEAVSGEISQSVETLGLAIDILWILMNFCIPFVAALAANIWSTLLPIKRA